MKPRRRTKARITLNQKLAALILLLIFGMMIIWMALITKMNKTSGSYSEIYTSSVVDQFIKNPAFVMVECQVSTPHSNKPTADAANGKFRISIFEKDANRKGSSAEAFLKLVSDHFYDQTYTFRVIPGFIVQWGVRSDESISSSPAKERILQSDLEAIPKKKSLSAVESKEDSTATMANRTHLLMVKENRRGTITMIKGPTGQIFINIADNRRLDSEGTIPFGVILEETPKSNNTGMKLIDSIYQGYKGGQGQIPAIKNHDIATKFPEMGRIDKCYRLS